MRTTVDLPDSLMRAAKAKAAERGESLKDLVNRAVGQEVGQPVAAKAKAGRVELPLIGRDAEPTVLVTNDDIAAVLEADDIERHTGR